MKQQSIATLTAAWCLFNAVAVWAQDQHDQYAATVPRLTRTADPQQERRGRLLQRRRTKHQSAKRARPNNDQLQERELESEENLSFHDDEISFEPAEPPTSSYGENPCKSIIAVDGWRLPSTNDTISTNDIIIGNIENYQDMDVNISYLEASEELVTDEEFVCELSNGNTLPIQGTNAQLIELRQMLNNGTLVSAESSVKTSATQGITQGDTLDEMVTLLPGEIELVPNNHRNRELNNGKNHMYEGTKNILVIRVTDSKGRSVPEKAPYVSDKLFGTLGDTMTMKSGFAACSLGKLQMTYDYGNYWNNHFRSIGALSAPGVLDVNIPIALDSSTQAQIVSSTTQAARNKLQMTNLLDLFDHVIMVLEHCYPIGTHCQFAAYAYTNHWLSVYFGPNYKYPAVVMHELGHNLNLAHSGGLDGQTYTDHTCLMGNPLFKDDVGRMCFNPAKNFQIAIGGGSWYEDKYIGRFDSGITGGTSWRGKIIGVSDYNNNPDEHPFIIKIESGGPADWMLGFNRVSGINSESQQAFNQVAVYRVSGGDGLKYTQSSLKAALVSGRRVTINNWRKSGLSMKITVNAIDILSSPGYADVSITFGPQPVPTPPPTKKPTFNPSTKPTKKPTFEPTRKPTSTPTTRKPTHVPSMKPTNDPTHPPTLPPTTEPTNDPTHPPSSQPIETYGPINGVEIFDSGTQGGTSWSGNIHSSAGKNNNPSSKPLSIMLTTDGSSEWFVEFSDTRVGIIKAEDGQRSVVGLLESGQTMTISNWRDTGLALVVFVTIVEAQSNSTGSSAILYATVVITFGPEPDVWNDEHAESSHMPTSIPTPIPTPIPSPSPTHEPTHEPTHKPTDKPTHKPTLQPTHKPTPSPTKACGNSVCEAGETPDTCPHDCFVETFSLSGGMDAYSGCQVFTIQSQKDITVYGFHVIGNSDGNTNGLVFTRPGLYHDVLSNHNAWDIIFNKEVSVQKYAHTDIGALNKHVPIRALSRQSFYICLRNGMVYEMGQHHNTREQGNDSLWIEEGLATSGPFRTATAIAKFRGAIKYFVN